MSDTDSKKRRRDERPGTGAVLFSIFLREYSDKQLEEFVLDRTRTMTPDQCAFAWMLMIHDFVPADTYAGKLFRVRLAGVLEDEGSFGHIDFDFWVKNIENFVPLNKNIAVWYSTDGGDPNHSRNDCWFGNACRRWNNACNLDLYLRLLEAVKKQ